MHVRSLPIGRVGHERACRRSNNHRSDTEDENIQDPGNVGWPDPGECYPRSDIVAVAPIGDAGTSGVLVGLQFGLAAVVTKSAGFTWTVISNWTDGAWPIVPVLRDWFGT